MTTKKLTALVNTTIKQLTIDSSEITDPKQKFSLDAGDELEINSYESAADNHWKLALTSPVNGVTKWFAYKPHVTISDLANEYTKTIYPGLVLDAYKKLEHALKTPVDRGLSEEEGRKIFEAGILPILQSADTFMEATAEGRQELDKRGNYLGIKKFPCAYSVSCVMKYLAGKLGLEKVAELFQDPFKVENIRVTEVEIKLRSLGFFYYLKDNYLAPRGAIGTRERNNHDVSGHIYFITKDGSKRTEFPNPDQGNLQDIREGKPEKGIDGPRWKIKDLHAENLHFFDHVYLQWENGYTEGFWLPPGIYPLKR